MRVVRVTPGLRPSPSLGRARRRRRRAPRRWPFADIEMGIVDRLDVRGDTSFHGKSNRANRMARISSGSANSRIESVSPSARRAAADTGIGEAHRVAGGRPQVCINLKMVGQMLEKRLVAAFAKSFADVCDTLAARTSRLAADHPRPTAKATAECFGPVGQVVEGSS
jgi:hypothetical protein